MKKTISFILTILIVSINILYANVYAEETNSWDIKILDIKEQEVLKTNEDITLYTGDVQTVVHEDKPKNQNDKYLLVNLYVNKIKDEQSVFNSNNVELMIEGISYKQLDNNFILKHKYNPFTKNDVKFGESEGYIVFEIPKDIHISENAKLTVGNKIVDLVVSNKANNTKLTNIETKTSIVDEQWEIEKQILMDYNIGEYTLKNPYIVQNPYKWAPLTAIAMFETDIEAEMTVNIKGKDKYTNVSKTIDGYNKSHKIPILGLYPGLKNEVEIVAKYKDGTTETSKIEIKTDNLPDDFVKVDLIKSLPEKMEDGMTFLGTEGRLVVVDSNADVRWHLEHNNYLIFKRLKNGNMLISDENPGLNGRMGFYEIDLLGKVYGHYSDPIGMHHDIIELPNGNFLVTSSEGDHYVEDRIIELDRKTGEVVNDINVRDVLDTDRFHQEGNNDWFHMNALWYDENDESVVVSGRYQGVVKLTYPEGKIKWILSENIGFENNMDKYILEPLDSKVRLPIGQHAPMIVEGLDQDANTIDILMFDNNTADLSRPKNEDDRFFSRAVMYRINEKNMTVEQLWEFGRELGRAYATNSVGDADCLSETGNILTTFGDRYGYREDNKLNNNISTIVETDRGEPAEVIYEVDVNFNDLRRVYRSERLPLYPEKWNLQLGEFKGEIKKDNKPSQILTFSKLKPTENKSEVIHGNLEYIKIENQKLDIKGWQSVPGVAADKYKTSIIFTSEKLNRKMEIVTHSRPDVTTHLNNTLKDNINYDNSGFSVSIPFSELEKNLEPGKYTIGIMIEAEGRKEYKDTEYYFTIEDKQVKSEKVENSDLLLKQSKVTKDINTELNKGNYTIDNPYIVNDPYNISPLSALLSFNTKESGTVIIQVKGKDDSTNIDHEFNKSSKQHIIPIYGLYPEYNNTVTVTFTSNSGKITKKEINIQTDKLPEDMQKAEVKVADKANMKNGLTFASSNYISAYDSNGEVRWYLNKGMVLDNATPIKRLANGNLAVMTAKQIRPMYYQTGLYEIDLLGRIYNEYVVEGIHHEIQELSNGNFIIASEKDDSTTEDYIVEINRKNGKVVRSWDIGEILGIEEIADETYQKRNLEDRTLMMEGSTKEEVKEAADHLNKHDWYHNNAVHYVEGDNSILASGRMQDTVVKFDAKTNKVKWILGDPNSTWSDKTKDKLLTPIGAEFEWQYGQHAVTQLPNGDIMLYDNGNFRTKDADKALDPKNNYSRAVIYRVDEEAMTVEQIWQYGKERGNELYTPYIGDVDYLGENHYLINFGGIISDSKGNRMDSPIELFNTQGAKGEAVVIEIKNDKVVNEFKLTHSFNANTYRAERIPLYYENQGYFDLNAVAKRLGENKVTNTVNIKFNKDFDDIMFGINKLVDEGDRLIANISIINFESGKDEMYLVLGKGSTNKVYDLQSETDIIINKTKLSKGSYELGLLVVDEDGNNHYTSLNKALNVG